MKQIKNEIEYKKALKRIEKLMDAEINTKEGEELDLLSRLVEEYETQNYPLPEPNTKDIYRYNIEQLNKQ